MFTRFHTKLLLFFVLVLSGFLLVGGYLPQMARYSRPDAVGKDNMWFAGWFAEDYRVYLSAITLGQNGYLLFRNPFTTEKLAALPYYSYYTVLGLLTGPFQIWPPYVYHIAKVLAITVFIGSSYFLATVVLRGKQSALLATAIGLIATTQPDFFYNQTIASSFTPWWKDWLEAISRLHQRPHYLLSEALLIFAVALFIKTRRSNTPLLFWACAMVAALATFMVPHAALPFLIIATLNSVIGLLANQHSTFGIRVSHFIASLFLCVPTIAVILFMRSVALADPVWLAYKDWEVNFWNQDWQFLYHYYISYWPLIIVSFFGLFTLVRNRNQERFLIVVWVLTPAIISIFATMMDMSRARLLLASIHVPLSIMAVIGLTAIQKRLNSRIVPAIICCVFFLYSFIMTGFQMNNLWQRAMAESTYFSLIYVPQEFKEGITAIHKTVPKDAALASGTIMGNLIPGFAPVITFLGHPTQALQWDEKIAASRRFYSGTLEEKEALQWLIKNNISYVLDDPEMKTFHSADLPYSFLVPVWQNSVMKLYRVASDPIQ